jgi:hypothetical protein
VLSFLMVAWPLGCKGREEQAFKRGHDTQKEAVRNAERIANERIAIMRQARVLTSEDKNFIHEWLTSPSDDQRRLALKAPQPPRQQEWNTSTGRRQKFVARPGTCRAENSSSLLPFTVR